MRTTLLSGLLASLCIGAVGCIGGEPVERMGRDRAAVKDGVATTGDSAVVTIYKTNVVLCTGALVTPRVVVTAAHCLHPDFLGGHDVTELEVRFGPKASPAESSATIAEGVPHPDFDLSTMDLDGNPDIGVVRLAEPATVEPLGIHHDALASLLVKGAPLRVVGYGVTAYGAMDYGTKRTADAAIDRVSIDSIELAPAAMCAGDSGGPYLFSHEGRDYVVAAHSNGNCTSTSEGTPTATVYESFILPFIEKDCVADGACLTLCKNVPDPDCATGEGGAGGATGGEGAGEPGRSDDDDGDPNEDESAGCSVNGEARSGAGPSGLLVLLFGLLSRWSRASARRRCSPRDASLSRHARGRCTTG